MANNMNIKQTIFDRVCEPGIIEKDKYYWVVTANGDIYPCKFKTYSEAKKKLNSLYPNNYISN